jgi:hypothetical protein
MKTSDVNHLRRLLAWVDCEIGQAPEEMQAMVKDIAAKLGNPEIDDDARRRLVEGHDKARSIPKYIRAAIKALQKTIGPGEIVPEPLTPPTDAELARLWNRFTDIPSNAKIQEWQEANAQIQALAGMPTEAMGMPADTSTAAEAQAMQLQSYQRIRIPTDTMEAEFQAHHTRGYKSRDREVSILREALSAISLAEKDSTTSDTDKVRDSARRARAALSMTKEQ